ncbi:hypothetical protein BH11MYX3_BH11MYX3_00280 [soil metagenome]
MLLVVLFARVATAEDREPVRLRLGTLAIDGSRYMKDILALGKEIDRRTRGGVELDWVSGGQLGEEAAMADLVVRGKLDGAGFSETGLVAIAPEMAAWGYPGQLEDYEGVDRATAALDASTRELFATRGTVFAMWADLGFSHLFASAPIGSLKDVLDRAAPWLTQPIDGALTAAIKSGRARAWTLPPLYLLAIGSTTAKAMTDLRYRYVVGGLVFSKAAWSRLTPAQRTTVLDVCHEWEPRIRASWRKESERGVAVLQKSGVVMRAVSSAERTTFGQVAATYRQARAKSAKLVGLSAKITAAATTP